MKKNRLYQTDTGSLSEWRKNRKMLLEEFENVPAVIEPTDRSIRDGGEVCDTIILSFNGEIVERVKQFEDVYEGGYLTNPKW